MTGWIAGTLLLPFLATGFAIAKEKNAPPQVVEYRDVPMQQSVFQDPKAPRDCNVSWVVPGQVCWTVQLIGWQSFNKQSKGISLIVNVWGDRMSTVSDFSWAALTIAVDGNVVDLPAMEWNDTNFSINGSSAVIKDEPLIRAIAAGKEVWITVHAQLRMSKMLSPRALASLKTVLDKYDSLDSASSRLEQLDLKLNALTQEAAELGKQSQALSAQGCTNEGCLNQLKGILTAGLKCAEAAGPLLKEKVSLLDAGPKDPASVEARGKAAQDQEQLPGGIEQINEVLAKIDRELSQIKKSGPAGP